MSQSQSAAAPPAPAAARPKPKPVRKRKHLPLYRVLLHNDDVNDMEYVVITIMELVHLAREEAQIKMLEAHHTGVSLLLVTHKEKAELLQEQFHSKRLTVTIEPDE
jgi:ATP-dependent Clp protease adaptor protein ClpS